jgi:hypothetical protein
LDAELELEGEEEEEEKEGRREEAPAVTPRPEKDAQKLTISSCWLKR